MAYLKGIDISKWQGSIDFTKVKASTGFVIMKATEGYGYTDPKFKTNQTGLREVKIPIGYYHFARPDLGNTAISEADWFVKKIGKLQTGEVLALDYEVNYSNPVNWCKAFLDRVQAKTGVKPLLYINLATNNKYKWSNVVKGNYGLWLAIWDGSLSKKPTTDWPFIAIKQYGADTKVTGISGNVDGDVFFGGVTTFKKYGYQVPVIKPPIVEPPKPIEPPVDLELKRLTSLVIVLNKQIEEKETALVALRGDLKVSRGENILMRKEIVGYIDGAKDCVEKFKKANLDRIEAVKKLNDYKKNIVKIFIEGTKKWIVSVLEKILRKN